MDGLSQQNSDGDGHDRKRDNVTEAGINRFLKIKPPHIQLISRAFVIRMVADISIFAGTELFDPTCLCIYAALHNLTNYGLPRTANAFCSPREVYNFQRVVNLPNE